jgi:chemotaxis response regulator CheB
MPLVLNEIANLGMTLGKMKPRLWQVLIIGTGSLLEQAVESLLASQADIRVSEVVFAREDTLIQAVLDMHPDVIVFHENGLLNSDRIFDLLRALPEMETLRVIILRSSNATIDFYEKRTVNAVRTEDFINLVRG